MEQLTLIQEIDFGHHGRKAVEDLPLDLQHEVREFNTITERSVALQQQRIDIDRELRVLEYARRGALSIVQELAQVLGEQLETSTPITSETVDSAVTEDGTGCGVVND